VKMSMGASIKDRRPPEILTTMVILSLPDTTSAYFIVVSPRNPNVRPLSTLTTKCVSSIFSMRFSSKIPI
jgi:hypothetical protein